MTSQIVFSAEWFVTFITRVLEKYREFFWRCFFICFYLWYPDLFNKLTRFSRISWVRFSFNLDEFASICPIFTNVLQIFYFTIVFQQFFFWILFSNIMYRNRPKLWHWKICHEYFHTKVYIQYTSILSLKVQHWTFSSWVRRACEYIQMLIRIYKLCFTI